LYNYLHILFNSYFLINVQLPFVGAHFLEKFCISYNLLDCIQQWSINFNLPKVFKNILLCLFLAFTNLLGNEGATRFLVIGKMGLLPTSLADVSIILGVVCSAFLLLLTVAIEPNIESGMVACIMIAVEYGSWVSVLIEACIVVYTLVVLEYDFEADSWVNTSSPHLKVITLAFSFRLTQLEMVTTLY